MKNMKKILALVLVALLVAAMFTAALADEYPGQITVTGQKIASGETTTTYEAYRIFDVAANSDYSSLSYTINSDWANFFTGSAAGAAYIVTTNDTNANNGDGYTPIVVDGVRKYIALTDSNVAAFGKAAFEWSQSNTLTPVASNATGSFTNLPLGYYMVYPKGANLNVGDYTSIVSLTTTKPTASVVQKAEYPTLEKVDDDESVELGQVVNYTLTSKVPDTTGYTTFTFTMHDQMTDGLTFNASSIDVKIDSVSIGAYAAETNEGGYTYAAEAPDSGYATAFGISIPVMEHQDKVGKTITVTYTATVNSAAVTQVEKNHATLEYSNNPKNNQDHTTTPPDEETVFSAKIIINKYDGTNTAAKLEGAKFVLRCKSVTSDNTQNPKATAQVGKYYKLVAATADTPAHAEWVAETAIDTKVTGNQAALESDIANAATVVTTDSTGAASFDGLENGEYELIEVAAPAGYNQIKGVADTVTVAGTNTATANIEYTSDIANNAGTELPSTGGIGTTLFYVGGGILVLAAVILLVTKRRMGAND